MSSQPVTSQPGSGQLKSPSDHLKLSKDPELVLIAEFTSRQEIKLRIKQNDDIPGAKVGCRQNFMQLLTFKLFIVSCSPAFTNFCVHHFF